MNVLILSASNPDKKAGIVARDLYFSLSAINNLDVKILVKPWGSFSDKNFIPFQSHISFYFNKIVRKLSKISISVGPNSKTKPIDFNYAVLNYDQTKTWYSTQSLLKKVPFKPDAIIVLFMPDFLSFKNLYELYKSANITIYIYMMDMAPMTGGCHYAWECKAYEKNCGQCPALYSDLENDQSKKNWEFKKYYIEQTKMVVIAGSEYQYRQLNKSSLYKNKAKEKILLSVDPDKFKPGNKLKAREYFDLPQNKKVLFFGAVNHKERRKGFLELIEALRKLKEDTQDSIVHLAIAGKPDYLMIRELPFDYTLLGELNHRMLAKAFNASDVFLCPSIEDSGPMMINQSLMCGTPVVAFEIGVAIDLVVTGITGYIAKNKDVDDFVTGIISLLKLNVFELEQMKVNCIKSAKNNCHPEIQAIKLSKLLLKDFCTYEN